MTYPGADPALDPDRAAVEQRRRAQEVEFTTYRAVQDIPWGNVPAYFKGEMVAKSTVEERGWLGLGLVERVDGQGESPAPAEPVSPVEAAPAVTPARTTVKKEA